jgi:predicted negative regulator of RcsB-dependent stress response
MPSGRGGQDASGRPRRADATAAQRPERDGRPDGRPDGPSRTAGAPPRPAAAGRRDAPTPSAGTGGPEDARRSRTGAGAARGSSAGRPPAGARRQEIEKRPYDPRREERRQATRVPLPEDVDPRQLDGDVRAELRSLSRETADGVARHLVATARLLDDDPEAALQHARAARALAGRVAAVREACGLAAYAAGEWTEALAELRAARRISGQPGHLAVLADCERALDRPERALACSDDPDVPRLAQDERVELVIVLAGARRDLGQADAAVLLLQDPARRTSAARPWAARLWYAYADALLAAGREDQAREWFTRAAELDAEGQTDAGERLLELDGVTFEDLDASDDAEQTGEPVDLAGLVKDVPRPAAVEDDQRPPPTADGAPPGRVAPERTPDRPSEASPPMVAPSRFAGPGVGAPAAPAPPEAVPTVTFQPAPDDADDADGAMRLFD